jgi:hydroxyacylglutathione hydrolase
VGYDYTIGFLQGGIEAWKKAGKELDEIKSINADELADTVQKNKDISILDVRKPGEYLSEHIASAENIPLDFINDSMPAIDKNKTYYVHCAAGYRSIIFISVLRARGYYKLIDVKGGFNAIKESGKINLKDYVCPSTLA